MESTAFKDASQFVKSGYEIPILDPAKLQAARDQARNLSAQSISQQMQQQVLRQILAGAGLGLAARGATGIYNSLLKPKESPTQPVVLDIPYVDEQKTRKKKAEGEGIVDTLKGWATGAGDYAKDIASAREAETVWGHPLFLPGTILGTGAAAYGGWKGLDMALNAMRKKEVEDDVNTAKKRYEMALLSQYDKPKVASQRDPLGEGLDQLFNKVGGADWPGAMLGTYLTAAPILALISGKLAYEAGRKRTKLYAMEKAKELRERHRFAQRPPEVFARPVPSKYVADNPPAPMIPELGPPDPAEEGFTEGGG
jgi:hypothetical protein